MVPLKIIDSKLDTTIIEPFSNFLSKSKITIAII